MKPGVVTIAWDREYPLHRKPGYHAYRKDGKVASVRCWWLCFAVAWYGKTDYDLVTKSWGWGGSGGK